LANEEKIDDPKEEATYEEDPSQFVDEDWNSDSEGKDSIVQVDKSSDDLRAMIQIFPPIGNGKHITDGMIHRALEQTNIKHGLDKAAISKAAKDRDYLKPIQIAKGTPPVDGQDAQLIFHYNKYRNEQDRSISNLNKVDYKELGNVINVHTDDILLEKIPATIGIEGQSVTGKLIRQNKGKDLRIRGSKGVRTSEDNLRFYSEVEGQVIFRNSEVRVESIYETESVGAKTGNIRFIGSVVISSIVEDGYTVEAEGDIRIGGEVGASTIKARGDITIGGGVLGGNRAVIDSDEGNIYCKFIQDAKINAGQDIFIEEYLRNSYVRSGNLVELTTDNKERGFITGGKTFAVKKIVCNNVGNEAEIRTELSAGVDGKLLAEIAELRKTFDHSVPELVNTTKVLLQLQKIRVANKVLDKKHKALLMTMLRKLLTIRNDNTILLENFQDMLIRGQSDGKASIRVKNTCHRDVRISVGGIQYSNQEKRNNVLFRNKDGTVRPIML
jgi:hypothetical protein